MLEVQYNFPSLGLGITEERRQDLLDSDVAALRYFAEGLKELGRKKPGSMNRQFMRQSWMMAL